MQKITISNLGPVKDCSIEIKNLMFFIGEQASGKSTICKAIYFFKSLKDDLLEIFYKNIDVIFQRSMMVLFDESFNITENDKSIKKDFNLALKNRFLKCFGNPKNYNNSKIVFSYKNNHNISLTIKNDNIYFDYSSEFDLEFYTIANQREEIMNKINIFKEQKKRGELTLDNQFIISQSNSIKSEYKEKIDILFNEKSEVIYIPAGRNLLSIASEMLSKINLENIDYLTRSFIERVQYKKKNLYNNIRDLNDLINFNKQYKGIRVKKDYYELAEELYTKILKGRYVYENGVDKLYYNDNDSVDLKFASSGQQEIIWILLFIFEIILDNNDVFLIIEEPESHLYPETQKNVIELVSLLHTINKSNKIIISTHSPYILTSINNLIYAKNVLSDKNENDILKIIDKRKMIDIKKVSAYKLEDNRLINIIDEEEKIIKAEEIDKVSEKVNNDFNKLFDLGYMK